MNASDTDQIDFILRSDSYGHRQGVNEAVLLPRTNAFLTAGQDAVVKLWKFEKVLIYIYFLML
jgi:hypothetical protein